MPNHGGKRRGAGRPVSTGSRATPVVSYRVSADQYGELVDAGKRFKPRLSPSMVAKERAFPEALVLICTDCGLTDVFHAEGRLTRSEAATARGWWQLGDGQRGRCPTCEAKG